MLDKVQAYLGPWLEDHLKQIYPTDWWDRCVMSVLVPEQCERALDNGATTPADLDLGMQITVFRGNWTLLRRRFHLNPQLYDDAATVKRIRNKYSHRTASIANDNRFEHDMETVSLFLKGLGASADLIGGERRGEESHTPRVSAMTFDSIIEAARADLSGNVRRAPWIGLEHGVVPLDTEQKLDQYLAAYGRMHVEKIRMALDSLSDAGTLLAAPISIVDWGCGQGLATCCFFDWLNNSQIDLGRVHRIHLIEPSAIALQRARDNIAKYAGQYNCKFDVRAIERYINDIQSEDFDISEINTTLHLFSNILDIESVDLDSLAQRIQNTFAGRQIFCCVGPLNNGASRIMEFAGKFGITPQQIEANCNGRLAHSNGTISMLTFVIDVGRSSVYKAEKEAVVPQNVQGNITLQRLLNRYSPCEDVLDSVLRFYTMSTELEQLKEPEVDEATPFVLTETGGVLGISFDDNCSGNTPFATCCRSYAAKCKSNADKQQTRWPKDLHFSLELAWNGGVYRLLYTTKILDELRQFDYDHDTIRLPLSEFSLDLACAEKLELSDETIAGIERALHSDDVSLGNLFNQIATVMPGAQLGTTQIFASFCEKQIALAQTYAELRSMNANLIRRNPLLKAFLENSEFESILDPVDPDELISAVPMDEYQRETIAHALSNRVSVVVGPPGCGKTQLLLNLLANSLIRGKKVLVASKNNKAVDNVSERFGRFDNNGCFLRFGSKRFLTETTIPKIADLLNLAQDQHYDDAPYADTIGQFDQARMEIARRVTLENERSNYNAALNAAQQLIPELETRLVGLMRDKGGILPEFCEKARCQLENEIRGYNEEKSELEGKVTIWGRELLAVRERESKILPNFLAKARDRLAREVQERENRLRAAENEIANFRREVQAEHERAASSVDEFTSQHCNFAALKGIESCKFTDLASRLRRAGAEIEYKAMGLRGIWTRLFGKDKLAKVVVDLLADVNGQIRSYLRSSDSRSRISDFRDWREICEFCQIQADALEAVIVDYRDPLERIRRDHEEKIEQLHRSIAATGREIEDARRTIRESRDIIRSAALLNEYTQSVFSNEIASEQQEASNNRELLSHNIENANGRMAEIQQFMKEAEGILSDEDELSKYTQKHYRLPIANRQRSIDTKMSSINREIVEKRNRSENAQSEIARIDSRLAEIDALKKRIQSVEFGQGMVALSLNHYLHANGAAQAIAAYKTCLPMRAGANQNNCIDATKQFLGACPLVAVTSLSVKNAFPSTEGLFDLLVIDEASQCDIASALPLILRAKQMVIIGDPMQLRHISKIDAEEELAIKRHLHLSGATHLKYSEMSLWDYARNWLPWCENDAPCALLKHYRCHPDIIGYSNEMFYRTLALGGLEVCTPQFDGDLQGIKWVDVQGRQDSDAVNRNDVEARKTVAIANQCAMRFPNASIGIVTPFKAQAEWINSRIPAELRDRTTVDTVHKFQGDEKDIMIYSLVVTSNSPDGKIRWIDYKVPNLVNVAVTRAKRLLVIVGNRNYIRTHSRTNLPLGHLENYVSIIEARDNVRANN